MTIIRIKELACLEHDPEKWKPVFGKDHAQTKILDYDPMDRSLDGRNALGLGAHFRLHRRLKVALTRGKAGHEIDELVPSAQHDAERPRHGVAAKGDLPDLVGNVPVAAAAGGKVDHVARAEAADLALLVGDEG